MSLLQINALGAFELWIDGLRAGDPARSKAKALLLYLALQRGTPISRERLIEIFWPGTEPHGGRANLNTVLWDVRRALRGNSEVSERFMTTTLSTVQLSGETVTDVSRFLSLASSGEVGLLREALTLYRGDFLEGDYCEWSVAQRERLASMYEDVQGRLLWSSRDPALARGLIERNPYHEEAYAILIEHELQSRRVAAARELAARAKTALAEVGVVPSGILLQALDAASAGNKTSKAARARIPTLLTKFLGRQTELAQIADASAQTRFLTLTGSGGVGKTRLSIKLAHDISERYPEDMWFVDLGRIEAPELTAKHICETLGIPDDAAGTHADRLVAYLSDRRALLILDNCEHVVKACAEIVSALLTQCAHVHIVATSRIRINVPGETVFRVPPLSPQDAFALFVDRARLVDRSFVASSADTIAAICTRLDHLPFAIELAAARIAIMTVEQLLAELEHRFQVLVETQRTSEIRRHLSLMELVNWSYKLLPEEEKQALQNCAVFPTDFSLEAFAAACAGEASGTPRSFETLLSLTDKSLVLPEPGELEKRYRLLETTKEFCQERLREAGQEKPARDRHAAYYFAYAEQTHRQLGNANIEKYMRRIQVENDNLRAALAWALAQKAPSRGIITCIASMLQYWREAGDFDEGRSWVERVLLECDDIDDGLRAWLYGCSALLAQGNGNIKLLKQGVEKGSKFFAAIENPSMRALFLYAKGLSHLHSSEHVEAEHSLSAALREARIAGDQLLASDALNALANIALQYRQELSHGRAQYEEALSIAREMHALKRAAVILLNLGMLCEQEGDFPTAISLTQEGIEICNLLPGKPLMETALLQLSTYEDQRGDFAAARTRLREALDFVRSKTELQDRVAFVLLLDGYVAVAEERGRLEDAGLLLGFCSAFRDTYDIGTVQASFGGTYDAAVARLEGGLEAKALAALRSRGRTLTRAQAVALMDRL